MFRREDDGVGRESDTGVMLAEPANAQDDRVATQRGEKGRDVFGVLSDADGKQGRVRNKSSPGRFTVECRDRKWLLQRGDSHINMMRENGINKGLSSSSTINKCKGSKRTRICSQIALNG